MCENYRLFHILDHQITKIITMRKLMFTFLALIGFMTIASAQSHSNVIKTSPLALAFGNFNATYEKVLNEKSSFLVSANYQYRLFGVDVNAFGVGAGWRYYFTHANKDVPAGFYIQPQAGANFGNVDDFNYTSIGFGAEIGYQWVWSSGFVLDLGIGPQYTILSGDYEEIDFDSDGGVFPSATLAIGYAW